MTEKLRAAWSKVVELRAKLNALPQDAVAETRSTAERELAAADTTLQSTLAEEPVSTPSPEGAPPRPSLSDYLRPYSRGDRIEGRAAEFNTHFKLNDQSQIPLDVIAGPELRADVVSTAPSDVPTSTAPVAPRIFARSRAVWLGVAMPVVPPGESQFPILSSGTVAAPLAKGGVSSAAAATFGVTSLKPRRIQSRYLIGVEDLREFPQAEESLVTDLRSVLSAKLDQQVIAGDGVDPNFTGILKSLANPAAAPAAVATWLDFVEAVAGGVDGIYAPEVADVKLLLGVQAYKYLITHKFQPQLTGDRATEESAQRHERVEEPNQRVGSGG